MSFLERKYSTLRSGERFLVVSDSANGGYFPVGEAKTEADAESFAKYNGISKTSARGARMSAVNDAYNGSDADATIAVYNRLRAVGPRGEIALNLLRACKCSERAKKYRGGNQKGSYKRQAYERKDWSIAQLADILGTFADQEGIAWGWGRDEKAAAFENVLFVELPDFGQISFHNRVRYPGPDHARPWDGARGLGSSRIIRFACAVLGDPQPEETAGERDVRNKDRSQGSPAPSPARRPRRAGGERRKGGGQDPGFFPF